MTKLYNVKIWDFEETHVLGSYTDEKDAELVRDLYNKGRPLEDRERAYIQTATLNPFIDDIKAGKRLYSVTVEHDGSVSEIQNLGVICTRGSLHLLRRTGYRYMDELQDLSDAVTGQVWAFSETEAVALAKVKLEELKAEGNIRVRGCGGTGDELNKEVEDDDVSGTAAEEAVRDQPD